MRKICHMGKIVMLKVPVCIAETGLEQYSKYHTGKINNIYLCCLII